MNNAEILLELDEIMQQAQGHGMPQPLLDRLAAIRQAISRKPADPPSPFSGGGPGEEK